MSAEKPQDQTTPPFPEKPTGLKTQGVAEEPRRGSFLLGLTGIALGTAGAFYALQWLREMNYRAPFLTGVLAGLFCLFLARRKSWVLGGLCAATTLCAALLYEWILSREIENYAFFDYLARLPDQDPKTLAFAGGGALLALWIGSGR
jgi:hypothetical protein